jgi:hypothetical protein
MLSALLAFAIGRVHAGGILAPESDRKACDKALSIAPNAAGDRSNVKPAANCNHVEKQLDRTIAAFGPATRRRPMPSANSAALDLPRCTRLRSQPPDGFEQALAGEHPHPPTQGPKCTRPVADRLAWLTTLTSQPVK